MEDFELSKYIYWEYSLAVLIITDVIRVLTKNIQTPFMQKIIVNFPKWITLFVAIILAVCDWLVFSKGTQFHFFQFTISFGVAVLGYDYVWKLIKDQFKKPQNETNP
jgi:hypothetical protein